MLRRAFLGTAIPATCTSCGAKVGVPLGKSAVAFLPCLLAMVAARHLLTFTLAAIAWLVGAAAMFILWFTFVPLVKKRTPLPWPCCLTRCSSRLPSAAAERQR